MKIALIYYSKLLAWVLFLVLISYVSSNFKTDKTTKMEITVKNDCLYKLQSKDVSEFYGYIFNNSSLRKNTWLIINEATEVPSTENPNMVTVTIKFSITVKKTSRYEYVCYRAKNCCVVNKNHKSI
jgi:hypothetical protein